MRNDIDENNSEYETDTNLMDNEFAHTDETVSNSANTDSTFVETASDIPGSANDESDRCTLEASVISEAKLLPKVKRIIPPYHQHAYLNYGGDPCAETINRVETLDFLRNLGFDGGELSQARHGTGLSEAIRQADANTDNMGVCSYCGSEISGVDYYRLKDGRLRCSTCSRTLVTTEEALSEIFNRIIENLGAFFGATIQVPIDIQMLSERKLKKKLKVPLSAVDNKSILVLGVAVEHNKKYSIFLENGAPRISVISTFAHELTHIWQYTHWQGKEYPKLAKIQRLLIYEGMAKWVEIQYLYLIGETAVAKREEEYTRSRNDEYGIGFRIYESEYPLSREAMNCGDSPFYSSGYPIK